MKNGHTGRGDHRFRLLVVAAVAAAAALTGCDEADTPPAEDPAAESPSHQGEPSPASDEAALEELYDRFLVVAECVRELGRPVTEPQSREDFVAAMRERPMAAWHPYDYVFTSGDQFAMEQVERECPLEE